MSTEKAYDSKLKKAIQCVNSETYVNGKNVWSRGWTGTRTPQYRGEMSYVMLNQAFLHINIAKN